MVKVTCICTATVQLTCLGFFDKQTEVVKISISMPPVSNNCCLVEGNFAVKVSSLLVQPLESAEELPYNNLTIVLYFFQPLNVEQYDMICNISNELRSYSPDVRILTTYYCGEYKTKPDVVSRRTLPLFRNKLS